MELPPIPKSLLTIIDATQTVAENLVSFHFFLTSFLNLSIVLKNIMTNWQCHPSKKICNKVTEV
jgi:hypothetical protein